MAQQTAINWIIDQIKDSNNLSYYGWSEIFEQAKQIEKEQIIQAFYDSELHNCGGLNDGENYYKYIYESNT